VVSPWAEHAAERLAEAGFRRGGARQAVLEALDAQRCAVSAAELEDLLRERGDRPVARASVYRILDELDGLRLVTRVDVGGGIARYEAHRPDGHHHHHLVCERCGAVAPFEDAELERAVHRLADRVDFDVARHDISLRGTCAACRAQDVV
jgi:Fur family transcriptional regulator, ferric uptake regulator